MAHFPPKRSTENLPLVAGNLTAGYNATEASPLTSLQTAR